MYNLHLLSALKTIGILEGGKKIWFYVGLSRKVFHKSEVKVEGDY